MRHDQGFALVGMLLLLGGCSHAEEVPSLGPARSTIEKPQPRIGAVVPAERRQAAEPAMLEHPLKLHLSIDDADTSKSPSRPARIRLSNRGDSSIQVYKEVSSDREAWLRVWDERSFPVKRTSAARAAMRPDPGEFRVVWDVVSGMDVDVAPGESLEWVRNLKTCFELSHGLHSAQAFVEVSWWDGGQTQFRTLESNVVEFRVSPSH